MISILRLRPLAPPALVTLIALFPCTALAQTAAQPAPGKTPVLVELFTSEGCSSCPPADALLGRLEREQPVKNADIIVLEEHVDYWEKDGWHDRFSSSAYTERQNQYRPPLKFDEGYTPQMVVDGSVQFVGNDPQKALTSITEATQSPKVALSLSAPVVDGKRIGCSVSAASSSPLPKADLYAAVVEPTASTEVKRGENNGRHLDHVGVVLSLQRIGKLQDLGSGPLKFTLKTPADNIAPESLRVVVFAQSPGQGPVRGAASISTTKQ
jgi:hypothetical protein